jgi:hypothetical protein
MNMRHSAIFAFGLSALLCAASASAQDAGRFDGKWDVSLACPSAPDGALPFTFNFTADVKNALLHGENGVAGRPGWMSLDGLINADGTASLDAHGLTGHSQFNTGHADPGISYHHIVTARFNDARGAGTWTTNRICDFTFTKE